MRGENLQTGILHPDEHHHHKVRCRVVSHQFASRLLLATIVQGRLIAVMTVRNEDRFVVQTGLRTADDVVVFDHPQPVDHAEMVGRHRGRQLQALVVEGFLNIGVLVRIQAKDRREVRVGGTNQHQPVKLRARQRLLVGKDVAGAELFEPNARQEAAAHKGLALPLELLRVNVHHVFLLVLQDAIDHPVLQETGGSGVLCVGAGIARLFAVQLEPDEVAGMLLEEIILLLFVDHVVGGRDHIGQVAHLRHVITPATKRTDFHHVANHFLNVGSNELSAVSGRSGAIG